MRRWNTQPSDSIQFWTLCFFYGTVFFVLFFLLLLFTLLHSFLTLFILCCLLSALVAYRMMSNKNAKQKWIRRQKKMESSSSSSTTEQQKQQPHKARSVDLPEWGDCEGSFVAPFDGKNLSFMFFISFFLLEVLRTYTIHYTHSSFPLSYWKGKTEWKEWCKIQNTKVNHFRALAHIPFNIILYWIIHIWSKAKQSKNILIITIFA